MGRRRECRCGSGCFREGEGEGEREPGGAKLWE